MSLDFDRRHRQAFSVMLFETSAGDYLYTFKRTAGASDFICFDYNLRRPT